MNSPTGICWGYLDGISVMSSRFELEKGRLKVSHIQQSHLFLLSAH